MTSKRSVLWPRVLLRRTGRRGKGYFFSGSVSVVLLLEGAGPCGAPRAAAWTVIGVYAGVSPRPYTNTVQVGTSRFF